MRIEDLTPSVPEAQWRTGYVDYLDGQLARITRPDGQAINMTYDPETGQLLAQALPSGQIYYRYDVTTGNLERIDAPGETLAYTYDGSLPTSESWIGMVAGSVGRTYDNNFRITSQTVNGTSGVAFTYDADDLLTGVGAMTLTRDAHTGLLSGTTLGSVSDAFGYNGVGEVTSYSASVGGGLVFAEVYSRDALRRISAKTETIGGVTSTYGYGYDLAGRLTDVMTNGSATSHYEYDLNGNRVSNANGDGVLSFNQAGTLFDATYDDQDRLLTTDHGPLSTSYTYTANGELLAKTDTSTNTSTTYTYDVLGNLTHVALPDGTQIDYLIDGQNRRVGKAVNGTVVQGWLYDGQLRIVAEINGSGAVVSRFVYGAKANVPDYVIQGGISYRILSDHLGSPRLVVNASSGAIVQRTDCDEFGNVLVDDVAPGFQRVPFGFAGGLYDPDTGLTRFGARDYDPQTGRWSAKDPIGFRGGSAHLYSYVASDPINRRDASGLFTASEQAAVMGVSGAVYGALSASLQPHATLSSIGANAAIWGVAGLVSVLPALPAGVSTLTAAGRLEAFYTSAILGGIASGSAAIAQGAAPPDVVVYTLAGLIGGPFGSSVTLQHALIGAAITNGVDLTYDVLVFVAEWCAGQGGCGTFITAP
jgi:RHS repeat-associated protein